MCVCASVCLCVCVCVGVCVCVCSRRNVGGPLSLGADWQAAAARLDRQQLEQWPRPIAIANRRDAVHGSRALPPARAPQPPHRPQARRCAFEAPGCTKRDAECSGLRGAVSLTCQCCRQPQVHVPPVNAVPVAVRWMQLMDMPPNALVNFLHIAAAVQSDPSLGGAAAVLTCCPATLSGHCWRVATTTSVPRCAPLCDSGQGFPARAPTPASRTLTTRRR